MNDSDLALINKIKTLDKAAKKGPWYPQGSKSKGAAVYRVGPAEEALIIALRNHVGDLLRIIEGRE
jgi:hypothetical protein